MMPPTANPITQGKHGPYNAVDYSAAPDPLIYAPEDITFHWYGLAGDCGNNLQVNGKTGRHGFCHLAEAYVKPGESKKKGEVLGKMGYTGLTIPKGPAGAHLHWVISRNGHYTFPLDLVTEKFQKGAHQLFNEGDNKTMYLKLFDQAAPDPGSRDFIGKSWHDVMHIVFNSPKLAERNARLKALEQANRELQARIKVLEAQKPDANAVQLKELIIKLTKG